MKRMQEKMEELAASFPCLRNKPGVKPWDANELDEWAAGPHPSHAQLCAACFVLSVWDPNASWVCGRFDLAEAIGVWDVEHRFALIQWVAEPWWP